MRVSSLAHRYRATARWRDSSRLAAEAGAGGTAAGARTVTTGRNGALGANTPQVRWRCARGGGTSAAIFVISSNGLGSNAAGRAQVRKAFESRPVSTLDAYRAIHREAAVVRPGAHFGSVIAVDQAALDEGAQDTIFATGVKHSCTCRRGRCAMMRGFP